MEYGTVYDYRNVYTVYLLLFFSFYNLRYPNGRLDRSWNQTDDVLRLFVHHRVRCSGMQNAINEMSLNIPVCFVAVENDNLMRSSVQLFDNEDDKELDLIASESLDIPDYDKNDISRNIPILSSSNKYVETYYRFFFLAHIVYRKYLI